jgi:hypothetical protein
MKNPVNAFLFAMMTAMAVLATGLSWVFIYLRG